ncbi:MAG: amylo-alpha-1,6-glucosidase [Candidatus Micrarchaeia archaeon]|jgi:hypothetical protein
MPQHSPPVTFLLETSIAPVENPDWNFARNRRIVLRRPDSELVQSCFSAGIGTFAGPNRDFSSEGFSAMIAGDNWKIADAFLVAARAGDETLALSAKEVLATPWKAQYFYDALAGGKKRGELCVEYYLFGESPNALLQISFEATGNSGITSVTVKPMADLRKMDAPSMPGEHKANSDGKTLRITRDGAELLLKSGEWEGCKILPPWERAQKWFYKLGCGNRAWRDGRLFFEGEERETFAPAEITLRLRKNKASLFAYAGHAGKIKTSNELRAYDEKKERTLAYRIIRENRAALELARKKWGQTAANALAARLFCLLSKFQAGGAQNCALEAGAMWFRQVWYRDFFEAINANFEIFREYNSKCLRRAIVGALQCQKNGLVPNFSSAERACWEKDANWRSIDATLLCLSAAFRFLEKSDDKVLRFLALQSCHKAISSLGAGITLPDGSGAKISENGLLWCSADWSWTDSRVARRCGNSEIPVPTRIPAEWAEKSLSLPENAAREKICGPHYALVEANALWISMLAKYAETAKGADKATCRALLEKAQKAFKETFFHAGKLCHIATIENGGLLRSDEISSASLCALATVPELFSGAEFQSALSECEKAFVRCGGKLHGMLVKIPASLQKGAFLGDAQYHGAVAWPRDAPYMIKALIIAGRENEAEEILLSSLAHQAECAAFYNNELFAPAEPSWANPSPFPAQGAGESEKPVPLKNPAQLWSQWVMPYFGFLKN